MLKHLEFGSVKSVRGGANSENECSLAYRNLKREGASKMKRSIKTALVSTILLCLLGFLFFKWLTLDGAAPRFQRADVQPAVGAYQSISYEFLNPSPFEGGKMWINVWSNGKGGHTFLYDMEKQLILGELINAAPGFFNHDQTKVLCVQRTGPPPNPTRSKAMTFIKTMIKTISGGKINPVDDVETFWSLDLERNSATRLGQANQLRGAGSSFFPSPGFRYGYNKPTGSFQNSGLFICDLEKNGFTKDPVDGWPCGWWNEHQILMKAPNNDFTLYDVVTRQSTPFLGLSQLKNFYQTNGLTNNPASASPFVMWNGSQYDFYLTDGNKRWSAVESFLAKITRPGPTLTLLNPHFKFEWSDHFDAAGGKYLYTGRTAGLTNSAVYLRDLQTGQIRELVAPERNHTNLFSIPFFYHDTVVYMRSNMLWEINLDGGNDHRFFPP